jgi:hypothetical protein
MGLTIDEAAARLGALVGAKRRAFEELGGWARSTADPHAKLALAGLSAHQGVGVQLLEPLLPVTRDHDPAAAIPVAAPGWWPADPVVPGTRLEASRTVLDRLVEAGEELLGVLGPVADRPLQRALALALSADREDRDRLAGGRIVGRNPPGDR